MLMEFEVIKLHIKFNKWTHCCLARVNVFCIGMVVCTNTHTWLKAQFNCGYEPLCSSHWLAYSVFSLYRSECLTHFNIFSVVRNTIYLSD